MKLLTSLILLALLPPLGLPVSGAESPGAPTNNHYRPLGPVGAPKVRTGAGTRGGADANLSLFVLAPDHVGLTTRAQPDLYYYAAPLGKTNLVFTLNHHDQQRTKPLIETALPPNAASPFQKIDLGKFNAPLDPEKDYKWSVAAVPDTKSRSKDIVASGIIRRTEVSPALRQRLANAGTNAWSVYAENGIWHDALSTLSDLIAKEPNNKTLRRQRAALLREIDLPEAARGDEDFKTN
jgi:hypothetical protein